MAALPRRRTLYYNILITKGVRDNMDQTSMRETLEPSFVNPMIARLMHDPSKVKGVIHDNGFYKFTLGQTTCGIVLRAHIWLEEHCLRQGDGNIHNHRWSFASRILQGAMTTASFKADDTGTLSLIHHTYRPGAPGIRHVGAARLSQVSSETFAEGEFYYLDATTLHRAQPEPGRTTVTLIARSKAEREYADVYASYHLSEASDSPKFLPPDLVTCELSRVQRLLSRPNHT
jgi:hypothetical protein